MNFGAALQEQNGVLRRDIQQSLQILFGLLDYGQEFFTPVAHFHDAHARSVPVVELQLSPLQHVLRQRRRADREIEDPIQELGDAGGRAFDLGC